MKVENLWRCVLIAALVVFWSSSNAHAVLLFDLEDFGVITNGAPQSGTLDLDVTHSGGDPSTFSSGTIRLDVAPTSGLSFGFTDNGTNNPNGYSPISVASAGPAGAFNFAFTNVFANVDVGTNGTLTVAKIDWMLDGAVVDQDFNIGLTMVSLSRFVPPDTLPSILSEAQVGSATFSASSTAIPEPSSFALAGFAFMGGVFFMVRRRLKSGSRCAETS